MLAVDLAASHPLGDLKGSLGGLKWCDAGLRPLRAGIPGLRSFVKTRTEVRGVNPS
jgi:hypothetical protein